MSTVHLLQIDGKIPNLALMRLATHYQQRGDAVIYHHADSIKSVHPFQFGTDDRIYASAIFRRSLPILEQLKWGRPDAIIGGTAVDPLRPDEVLPFPLSPLIQSEVTALENHGVTTEAMDYSMYPHFRQSVGFTQRGCRLNCSFCGVPGKEGKVREVATVADIWRGDPWPREVLLLDNDFFGQPHWRDRITELRDGNFKVSFNQGINARCITDEAAEALASVNYRDDQMKDKRIYTAWDNRADEDRLFAGLNRLVKYGVKPDHIMVYMLCGYWPGETQEDREYRRKKLRDFGCRPFQMAYTKTPELMGFQRWVIRRADVGRNACSWEDFVAANYRPEKVGKK